MAKKLIPSVQEQKDPQGFPALLASAVYEWFLIFLLFVNALLSYLVTKFARFCKLQPPCLLCSRLDDVVGNEKPGFYKNYLCSAHKLEISSLVFCPIHDKLADVHGMCESCLFSFATEKKSNSEAYKLLVGKLGSELYRCRDQDSQKNSLCKSHCSCCNDTWTSRTYFHKLLQTKSLGAQVAERETPSPGSTGHSRVRDNLKKKNRKQSGQKEWSYLRSRSFDPLSHIGYSELKITSESESKVPFSDEDDASGLVHEAEEFAAQSVQLKAHTTDPQTVFKTPHDLAQEELIYQASIPRPSLSVSDEQVDVGVSHDLQSSTSSAAIPRPSLLVSDEQLDVSVSHDVQSSTSTVAIPRPSLLVSDEQVDVGVPHDVQSSTSAVAIPRPSLLVSDEQVDVGVPHDVQSSTSTVAIPRPSLLVSDEQVDVGLPHDMQSSTSTVAIPKPSLLVSDEQVDVGVPHDVQSSTSTVAIPRPSLLVSDEQVDVSLPHDMQSSTSTVAIPSPSLLVSDEQVDVGVPHDVQSSTSTVAISRPSLLVSDEQLDVGLPHDMQSSTSTVAIPRPSLLVSDEQLDVSVPLDVQSSTSTVAIVHGLEEPKWHQAERQIELPSPPEFISLKDVPAPPEFVSLKDIPLPSEIAEVSGKTLITIGDGDSDQLSVTEAGEVAKLETDLVMPTEPCLTMSLVVEVSEGTCATDVAVIADNGQTSVIQSVELHKLENGEIHNLERGLSTTSGPCSKTEQVLNDAGPPVPSLVGLTDVYKLAVGNKSQVSSMLAEQLTGKDSTRVTEDLKLLLSQVSAIPGIELSSNEMSPRMHLHGEESKDYDSSSSMKLQFFPKRVSMERNESGSESLDGSIVSEIEGESVVDRLKRQVEYDSKSMSALYKELEEERNASAIAANQAMAMITRLQEEKASLHMEALQYLRMMEEQAEYDVDELQKANDLLVDKEKEIQDLEYELEMYRRKFSNESMDENIQEPWCDSNGEDMGMEHPDESCIGLNTNLPCNSLVSKESEGSNVYEKNDMVNGEHCMSDVKDSLLNFDDERIYISECLKKLGKQLHVVVSTNGVNGDISNGGYSVKESHDMNDLDQPHCREESHGNGQLQEDEASVQKDSSIDGLSTQESCNPSIGNSQFVGKENHHFDSDGQDSIAEVGTPLAVIENEFSDLNERLDALEADRTFLEHSINALQSGDEGVKFLKEIALHLRELRRFGIRRGDQTVA